MAWRLEKAVEHGEIDNTVPGTTTGRIWLRGMDEPLLLSLEGDCWRDLAGARLEFTNPAPQAGANLASIDPDQVGLMGDMTAALRVCYSARRTGNDVRWRNTLYLEWFSETNGRVLIESTNFKLRISEHVWRMDEDEEEAQKLANLQAMREFMARMIGRKESADHFGGSHDDDVVLDEDQIQKDSERVSRAFGEVLEKYGDDPESERKEAFVMGWDRKLEALAEREEALNMRIPPMPNHDPDEVDADDGDDDADDDWSKLMETCMEDFDEEDFYSDEEPVVEKSREVCLRAMDLVDREAESGTPDYQVTSSLLEVSSKLAGAMECREDEDYGATYVLALLKQCLGLINDSLSGLQVIVKQADDADHRAALDHLQSEVFSMRDDIIELRREIREEM